MNVGIEVSRRFMKLCGIGLLIISATIVAMLVPGMPYSAYPALALAPLQLSSGGVLVCSGLIGAVCAAVTETIPSSRYAWVKGLLVLQGLTFISLLAGAWVSYSLFSSYAETNTVTGQGLSFQITIIVVLLLLLAIITFDRANLHLVRVYALYYHR